MKIAALAWALVVATAGATLVPQLRRGIELQTDITALLPFEERDATIRRAKDRLTEILTERVFLLVGDNDRANALAGGATLAKALSDSGMTKAVTYRTRSDSLKSLSEMYFPYRFGLLSNADRERLKENKGEQILDRAIASVYGPSSMVDANLLRRDPFLLMPEFLSNLPMPAARLTPDDGVLTTRNGGQTWAFGCATEWQCLFRCVSGSIHHKTQCGRTKPRRRNATSADLTRRRDILRAGWREKRDYRNRSPQLRFVRRDGRFDPDRIPGDQAGVADLARNRSRSSVRLRCMRLDIRRPSRCGSVVRG